MAIMIIIVKKLALTITKKMNGRDKKKKISTTKLIRGAALGIFQLPIKPIDQLRVIPISYINHFKDKKIPLFKFRQKLSIYYALL